jgi:hypothetical protein
MVGWENRSENAPSASAAENQFQLVGNKVLSLRLVLVAMEKELKMAMSAPLGKAL